MSGREAALSAALVFVVAVVVRAVAAAAMPFPRPEDTSYYVQVGRHLLEGRGLVSDALWSYATPPLVFPRPAFEVWLPLPTFLAVIPMALLGPSYAAAQVSSVVVGSLVPVLGWRLAADVATERRLPAGRARTVVLGVGLTAAVYMPLVLHSALPDSTMPFAALTLAACLLMTRILRDPRGARLGDLRLLGLGVVLGLAALTRNEVVWLALVWVGLVWRRPGLPVADRLRLIGVVGVVSLALFAPWAYRNWVEFGSPLPGQAVANALSLRGTDVFAWADPPSLARYLAEGPGRLLELRLIGLGHNLLSVLLLLGLPASAVGLATLPWFGRGAALRPLLIVSVVTFLVTALVFSVSTTWGTYLHAGGAMHVLVLVSAMLALDAGIARIGAARGWTRPVAWLGPAFAVFGSIVFSVVLLGAFARGSTGERDRWAAFAVALPAAGFPLGPEEGPIISDYPIWLADTTGNPALALPEESPADVVALARAFPGTRGVLVVGDPEGERIWPAVLDAGLPRSNCFVPVPLTPPPDPALAAAIDGTRLYRLDCP